MRRRIEADEYDSEVELRVADKARIHALRDGGGRPKKKVNFMRDKLHLGSNPAVVIDTNVFINAQLIRGHVENKSLLDMVDQNRVTMCVIPPIRREMSRQINLHSADAGAEISGWLLGILARAVLLPIVPRYHRPHIHLKDKSDEMFVAALYRLRYLRRNGVLVTSDKELLELSKKEEKLQGAILLPKEYLQQLKLG